MSPFNTGIECECECDARSGTVAESTAEING